MITANDAILMDCFIVFLFHENTSRNVMLSRFSWIFP